MLIWFYYDNCQLKIDSHLMMTMHSPDMPLLPLSSTDHTLSDTPLLLFLLYILCTLSSLYALSTLDSFNLARTDHSYSLFQYLIYGSHNENIQVQFCAHWDRPGFHGLYHRPLTISFALALQVHTNTVSG